MSNDARVNAWIGSTRNIEAAGKIAAECGEHGLSALPDFYWGALHAASTLAALANVPVSVGEGAAEELREIERQRAQQQQKHIQEMLGRLKR